MKIEVEGENIPGPCPAFTEMCIPSALIEVLENTHRIKSPSPIQQQGIPIALMGRDMIGVASTGSGKTLAFLIPVLMLAFEAEARMGFTKDEGPISLILVPSRELARQIFGVLRELAVSMRKLNRSFPRIQILLAIGGESQRDLFRDIDSRYGVHVVIGTTGRVLDFLRRGLFSLAQCQQIVLDEADGLVDGGFEDELRQILSQLASPHQTLIFSATMPDAVRSFIRMAMRRDAIQVSVEANLVNIKQEFEPARSQEALLRVLGKTKPPVIVFGGSREQVDDILEVLLVRGILAKGIHSGMSQEERSTAIEAMRKGVCEVLVASGVVAKGLDIPQIQHVINWELPDTIEQYIHRIGRTGRGGREGLASSFLGEGDSEQLLSEICELLKSSGQPIPSCLCND